MEDSFGKVGLYYLLNTERLQGKLKALGLTERAVFEKADSAKIARLMAKTISDELEDFIREKIESNDEKTPLTLPNLLAELPTAEQVIQGIRQAIPCDDNVLKEIKLLPAAGEKPRPTTELTESAIIVPDGHSPQLGNEIERELCSSDHVDWLVSFIKLRAINSFYPRLLDFCQTPNPDGSPRLRIATTTYCGISDVKALEKLFALPNTEVKVSFNASNTRLHAKVYIFKRNSGYGSAYVGSANLSNAAMSSGMEWTVKVAQTEMPYLWRRANQAFEACWNNDDFELCHEADLERIREALHSSRIVVHRTNEGNTGNSLQHIVLRPHPFQKDFLKKLEVEREQEGKNRHLVVSATGTGKTMVAAFDFANACQKAKSQGMPTLLYIAHRKDILEQAREKYRAVLGMQNFGYVGTDGDGNGNNYRQIFCTITTWKNKLRDNLPKDYFSYIVIDECHHTSEDGGYHDFLAFYAESINQGHTDLLGLTATPFRTDGYDICSDFGGKISHELSLAEAIENSHIVPFTYFGVDDEVDYGDIDWGKRQAENQIECLLKNNGKHFENVYNCLVDHVSDIEQLRAIGFCAGVEHAKSICAFMNAHGIASEVLTGQSSMEERARSIKAMEEFPSRVKIIFTADLFNEGVDIPCVNTELMLRPTNSPLIFVQQLGRGLRLAPLPYAKNDLLVLDFVGNHNAKYKGFLRYRAMSSRKDIPLQKQIEEGMPFLPPGCSVTLSQKSRERILKNIREYMNGLKGKRLKKFLLDAIRQNGRYLNLQKMMEIVVCDSPAPIYNIGTPSILAEECLQNMTPVRDDGRSFNLLSQNNSPFVLNCWKRILAGENIQDLSQEEIRLAKFFLLSTFNDKAKLDNVDYLWDSFTHGHGIIQDLQEFLDWRCQKTESAKVVTFPQTTRFLELHRAYSTKQISACIGRNGTVIMQGTCYNSEKDLDAFFITVNKSEKDFSPSTMYHDYAKTQSVFHWESPSRTREISSEGQRYISGTSTKMLFIRQDKKERLDITGTYPIGALPSDYIFLGPVSTLLRHENECPIEFDWELEHEMPSNVFEYARC